MALAQAVVDADGLRLRGVMGIAPQDADPEDAFRSLAQVSDVVRNRFREARWLSAGMSGDLEAAIRAGATHVRVGTAILGNRPTQR